MKRGRLIYSSSATLTRPYWSGIYPAGSSMTPLTQAARDDFAAYAASVAAQLLTVRDFIIGNESNLNRFWMPQFDRSSHDVAAPAYEALPGVDLRRHQGGRPDA